MPDFEPTGGTAGEPAAPGADGSRSLADEVLADLDKPVAPEQPTPGFQMDDDFRKKLASLKPGDLPEEFRRELEKPFLSNMTKQTTEWDKERQSYQDFIEKALSRAETGRPTPPNFQEQIKNHLAEGDIESALAIMREDLRNEITPERQYVSTMNAINEATQLMPELAMYESTVADTFKNDAVLQELSSLQNRKYAGRVLAGLGYQAKATALEAKVKELEASFDKRVRAAIDETQRRIKGLPPSTSRAGTTPTAEPATKELSLRESMEAAWTEQVGAGR